MDQNAFIASLVGSVLSFLGAAAWPLAVAFLAFLFRAEIRHALARPLSEVDVLGVKAKWDQVAGHTATDVVKATATEQVGLAQAGAAIAPPAPHLLMELAETAKKEPAEAVYQAFSRVDGALADLLRAKGQLGPEEEHPWPELLERARIERVVAPDMADALDGLYVLRNLTAYGQPIDTEKAMDYLAMADAVRYALRRQMTLPGAAALPK